MTKEISAGIEGDTELGDQVSNHTVPVVRSQGYKMCVYR